MMDLPPGTLRTLGDWLGRENEGQEAQPESRPVWRCLSDPLRPWEDRLRELAKATGPIASQFHQRERDARDTGAVPLTLRVCCAAYMREYDRQLPYLHLPIEVTCPDCGARYEIAWAVTVSATR